MDSSGHHQNNSNNNYNQHPVFGKKLDFMHSGNRYKSINVNNNYHYSNYNSHNVIGDNRPSGQPAFHPGGKSNSLNSYDMRNYYSKEFDYQQGQLVHSPNPNYYQNNNNYDSNVSNVTNGMNMLGISNNLMNNMGNMNLNANMYSPMGNMNIGSNINAKSSINNMNGSGTGTKIMYNNTPMGGNQISNMGLNMNVNHTMNNMGNMNNNNMSNMTFFQNNPLYDESLFTPSVPLINNKDDTLQKKKLIKNTQNKKTYNSGDMNQEINLENVLIN